jgi:hypothetical protein
LNARGLRRRAPRRGRWPGSPGGVSPKRAQRLRRFAGRMSQANNDTSRVTHRASSRMVFRPVRDTRNACPRAVHRAKMALQVSARCSRALPAASCLKARDCALCSKSFRLSLCENHSGMGASVPICRARAPRALLPCTVCAANLLSFLSLLLLFSLLTFPHLILPHSPSSHASHASLSFLLSPAPQVRLRLP